MSYFDYEPMTDEECEKERQYQMVEPGIYDFQVIFAESRISKSGNSMIELKLKIYNNNGIEYIIIDYLLGTRNMGWKTKHFCDSVGLSEEYNKKEFNEILCLNKCGKANIIIKKGNQKEDGTFYKDKNEIKDYISSNKNVKTSQLNTLGISNSSHEYEDLPF